MRSKGCSALSAETLARSRMSCTLSREVLLLRAQPPFSAVAMYGSPLAQWPLTNPAPPHLLSRCLHLAALPAVP